ncbi:hypothetical protein A2U01_0065400, partial [Trifolium medium]|nr:hypothetical protein [Trifolium medium]
MNEGEKKRTFGDVDKGEGEKNVRMGSQGKDTGRMEAGVPVGAVVVRLGAVEGRK